jgi:hypothetical protein
MDDKYEYECRMYNLINHRCILVNRLIFQCRFREDMTSTCSLQCVFVKGGLCISI